MRTIRDKLGKVRYTVRDMSTEKQILDPNMNLLGFIRDGKTYDKNGALVAFGEDISLLIVGG